MRQLRCFSTTFGRSRQALFEEFVRPLNNEQKKAMRKEANRNVPKIHPSLAQDMKCILETYRTPSRMVTARRELAEELRKIVRKHFGRGYDVQDVSAHTYSRDLRISPFEFAIVDTKRPLGLSKSDLEGRHRVNSEVSMDLPEAYNPSSLAAVLQAEGFDGVFEESHNIPPPSPWERPTRSGEMLWPHNYIPWPTFRMPLSRKILHPVKLYVRSPESFVLYTASPTNPLLVRLLRAYVSGIDGLEDLLSGLHLWAHSRQLLGLNPTCIALMAIRVVQSVKNAPSLQTSKDGTAAHTSTIGPPHVWMPQQWLTGKEQEWAMDLYKVDGAFADIPSIARLNNPGRFMLDFFGEFAYSQAPCQLLSIRDPTIPIRNVPIAPRKQYQPLQPEDITPDNIVQGQKVKLVVEDPFNITHNHAAAVVGARYAYFRHHVALAARKLRSNYPLNEILGAFRAPSPSDGDHIPAKRVRASWTALQASPAPQSSRTLGLRSRAFHTSAVHYGKNGMTARDASNLPVVTNIPPEVLMARRRIVRRVERAVQAAFGEEYCIRLFGSTCYGIDSVTSDLDMVLLDPRNPRGWVAGRRGNGSPTGIYNLRQIGRILTRAKFQKVTVVPAKVPIVKFTDRASGLSCDLNVNERLGYMNSLMIKEYCKISPLLRQVVIAIKQWAKPIGLNKPSGPGPITFSSYALTLMTIALFQTWRILPNLQGGLPPLSPKETRVFWTATTKRAKQSDYVCCDIRFSLRNSVPDWKPQVNMEFDDALCAWFRYWGHEHNNVENLVSIRLGGIVPRPTALSRAAPLSPGGDQKVARDETGSEAVLKDDFVTQPSSPTSVSDDNKCLPQYRDLDDAQDAALTPERGASISNADDASGPEEFDLPAEDDSPEEFEYPLPADRPLWLGHPWVVADPFIVTKNVISNVSEDQLSRFQAECRRSLELLESGHTFEAILVKSKSGKKSKQERQQNRKIAKLISPPKPKPSGTVVPSLRNTSPQGKVTSAANAPPADEDITRIPC